MSFSDSRDAYGGLPPITTDTLPTEIERKIAVQSWDRVGARQPPGSHENEPTVDTLISFVSAILEGRLVDVVRNRRGLKLANKSRRFSLDDGSQGKWDGAEFSLPCEGGRLGAVSPPAQATVLLTSTCRYQLRAYVRRIASMYRDNRYHGLEHATHVTMSANKLIEMLHEGAMESDGDADDTKINGSSVCEPHTSIVATAKLSLHEDSLQMSKNGFKTSMGALNDSASCSNISSVANARNSNSPNIIDGIHPNPKRSKLLQSMKQLIHPDVFSKFAFAFAAFIHDVDHQGVPNTRLVLENDPIVEQHGNLSVAEKHSIKVAFRTLSESDFGVFRSVIFESQDDHFQLHRIVTNVVLSTDIASPERAKSTRMRWDEAFFHPPPNSSLSIDRLSSLAGKSHLSDIATVQASKPQLMPMQDFSNTHQGKQSGRSLQKRSVQLNGGQTVEFFSECSDDGDDNGARTALQHSVVVETMMNVADVAHSMQSWELFLFWNRRLFEELYVAFKMGRSIIDPSNDWYENQVGFYKLYIIPLAEKMHTCGVFGKLGREWMNNAVLILDRWSMEGEQISKDMIASVKSIF